MKYGMNQWNRIVYEEKTISFSLIICENFQNVHLCPDIQSSWTGLFKAVFI